MRNSVIQAAILIAAAVVLALVSNAFASRDRKMKLVGYYPNATTVPARESAAPPAPVAAPPAVTATTATQAPAVTATTITATATKPETGNQKPEVAAKPAAASPTAAAPPPVAAKPAPKGDALAKFTPHEKQAYIEIAYDDVKMLHDHGALFLDARRTSVYEQGHIAGARPMSVWESDIDDKVAKLLDERQDPAQQALPIVAYCSGGDCEDSHMLAQKLYGTFFNNVYVYKDGFPDWQKHGGPIHTGGQP